MHHTLTCIVSVYTNVQSLVDIHCIRYLTAVNSIHSTSPPLQKYRHITSGSVEAPVATTARNSSSIRKVPVPYGTRIRRSATNRFVSQAEQGSTTFTNMVQEYKTMVCGYSTVQNKTTCGPKCTGLQLCRPMWHQVVSSSNW